MAWLTANWGLLASILLIASEAAAAISQLVAPGNTGVSGFFAGVIKLLQGAGVKPPGQ